MKIGINALSLDLYGGGNTFVVNLLSSLAKIDKDNTYYIFINKENISRYNIVQENFVFIDLHVSKNNIFLRLFYEHIIIPKIINSINLDLFYSPTDILPYFLRGIKCIVTFQNNLFYEPDYQKYISHGRLGIFYMKALVSGSLRKAAKILAVSQSARADLLAYNSDLANKIEVVYEGVENNFRPPEKADLPLWEEINNKLNMRSSYILFVSQISPYKNLDKVIEAFKVMRIDKGYGGQLVVVGSMLRKDYSRYLHDLIDKNSLKSDVIFIDYLNRNDLKLFYGFADLLIYPSACETFGLPVIEAMACGCPVVISNRKSLPEIAGDAAVIVDPDNIGDIADAAFRIINDSEFRGRLIERGKRRIQEFSWQKTAEGLLKLFKELYYLSG